MSSYLFPIAAVIDYHPLSGLQLCRFIIYTSVGQKSHGTNIRVTAELAAFQSSKELPLVLTLESAAFLFVAILSSTPGALHLQTSLLHFCFLFKDHPDSIGLTWITQDNLPLSKSLMLSHLQSPFCYNMNTSFSDYNILGGALICLPQTTLWPQRFTSIPYAKYTHPILKL